MDITYNYDNGNLALDHFITKNGKCYAGTHLIIDLWDANYLDDIDIIKRMMEDSVKEANATLLHLHLHHFSPNNGVSGVAILAESHISIHTWPEMKYAALDVFMCGDSEPEKTIRIMRNAFNTNNIKVTTILRGEL